MCLVRLGQFILTTMVRNGTHMKSKLHVGGTHVLKFQVDGMVTTLYSPISVGGKLAWK
jgi:hypothetical protein